MKKPTPKRTAFALVTIVVLLGLWLSTQFQIDGCLDQGGAWNYQEGKCEFELSSPPQETDK